MKNLYSKKKILGILEFQDLTQDMTQNFEFSRGLRVATWSKSIWWLRDVSLLHGRSLDSGDMAVQSDKSICWSATTFPLRQSGSHCHSVSKLILRSKEARQQPIFSTKI